MVARIIKEANFVIEKKTTIRATAEHFKLSKSTIHQDLSLKLKKIDAFLYEQVREVLQKNLKERHLRGGQSTKRRFSKIT